MIINPLKRVRTSCGWRSFLEDSWKEKKFRGLLKNFTTSSEQWKLRFSNPQQFIPPCFIRSVFNSWSSRLHLFEAMRSWTIQKSCNQWERGKREKTYQTQMRLYCHHLLRLYFDVFQPSVSHPIWYWLYYIITIFTTCIHCHKIIGEENI